MFNKDSHITSTELKRLIAGCVEQDRTCQKEIYQLWAPQMMSLSLRYAKNNEEAEEVLQDGFIRAFKNMHQFKNAGSFGGWLRKIVINSALQKFLYYQKINNADQLSFSKQYNPFAAQ